MDFVLIYSKINELDKEFENKRQTLFEKFENDKQIIITNNTELILDYNKDKELKWAELANENVDTINNLLVAEAKILDDRDKDLEKESKSYLEIISKITDAFKNKPTQDFLKAKKAADKDNSNKINDIQEKYDNLLSKIKTEKERINTDKQNKSDNLVIYLSNKQIDVNNTIESNNAKLDEMHRVLMNNLESLELDKKSQIENLKNEKI